MFKVEDLIEPAASEALINGVGGKPYGRSCTPYQIKGY
jgi:hypothetical protein